MAPAVVLFACRKNAGRSQLSEALFNLYADPEKATSISAGSEPIACMYVEVPIIMKVRSRPPPGVPVSSQHDVIQMKLARLAGDIISIWKPIVGGHGRISKTKGSIQACLDPCPDLLRCVFRQRSDLSSGLSNCHRG